MAIRVEYQLRICINGRTLTRVVIDQHYKEKHSQAVSDELILDLVKELSDQTFPIEMERGDYQYFAVEPVYKGEAPYRLVLVLYIHDDYLGVINAFRVERKNDQIPE